MLLPVQGEDELLPLCFDLCESSELRKLAPAVTPELYVLDVRLVEAVARQVGSQPLLHRRHALGIVVLDLVEACDEHGIARGRDGALLLEVAAGDHLHAAQTDEEYREEHADEHKRRH